MRFKKTSLHPVLVLLAVALVSVFFVVACGDDEDTAASEGVGAAEPKYGGTLTMTMVADFGSMDPAFTSSQVDLIITQSLYDNLVMIQPDGTRKPELAESWEFNEDNSSLTFNLRQGVKFRHLEDGVVVTGKEFKAEDVLLHHQPDHRPGVGLRVTAHIRIKRRGYGRRRRLHCPLRPRRPQRVLPGRLFATAGADHPRRRGCRAADPGGLRHWALLA